MPEVRVPADRMVHWVENFERRHGATALEVADGALLGRAEDGSAFVAELPFARAYDGPPDPGRLVHAAALPPDWGILLVRKGGFAVARLHGAEVVAQKVGRRHVQGRSKAGGWSQQRFARRRGEQARQAFEAAADHAARLLDGLGRVGGPLVTGGDHAAVEEVLDRPGLRELMVVGPWLAVPDPRSATLEQARADASAVAVAVTNADA
ncbi:acVLRF1 family peptidyl-tRNA hydrolase [Nocardioides insulae]|uniref:acVLRF1 family peptidyl-tRNA hydrolase n=1 Tax=Nocardioides insulae TaxID=394734 RepID=UPI00048CF24E|nr:acVLRF1 family peptidyl-tRNA hydrolase [Nocardioides insulae]